MNESTALFNLSLIKKENIKTTLQSVYDSLLEKGYNPVNQIVGYLMTGELEYISNYKDSREKIMELDRSEIIEFLLSQFIK